MKIAVDLMGSEKSPLSIFQASIESLSRIPGATLLFLATPTQVSELSLFVPSLQIKEENQHRISFLSCGDEILMADDPLLSIRAKKNSSLVVGVKLLRRKKVDAFVTLGNTGALIVAATLFLPKFEGIRRPALVVQMPSLKEPVAVLDVGGHVQLKAKLLYEFARLGTHYSRFVTKIADPTVALLNIGTESKKGTLVHQEAFRLLSHCPGFIGNIESREVFSGKANVVVTDGFAGNIFLKAAEGTAQILLDLFRRKNPALFEKEGGSEFALFDYRKHPGALLLGIDGIVVKVHGEGSSASIIESIVKAYSFVEGGFLAASKKDL